MSQPEPNRTLLKEKAERDSATADMKQHANKLIQGFEAFDITHVRRAIWELVQNARDLSAHSVIKICLTNDYISFTHNGKPFTSQTLLSLIKQVSSKSDDKLNETNEEAEVEEVGQYGTGFITTHAFGKRFEISGSLEIEPGTYINLDKFEINRVASKSSILAGKLVDQQNAVFALIQDSVFSSSLNDTTFTYFFDEEQERENAKNALDLYTEHYVPLVMALNGRIKSINLENKINGTEKKFEKETEYEENGVQVNPIKIDGEETVNIFSLHNPEAELIIILPLSSRYQTRMWGEDMGKLFLYFPLIGTEAWGSNFIIHCGKFSPTEKRDGLHLKSANSQTKEKEESNRKILEIASEMVFNFMKANESAITDPINLAQIAFLTDGDHNLVNEYYEELKLSWVEEFEGIKLVEINAPEIDAAEIIDPVRSTLITPNEASFLAIDFSNQSNYWTAIYAVISKFWDKIPKSELSEQWTKIVLDWNDPNLDFVTIDAVCEHIESEGELTKFDQKTLIEFYTFLVASGNTDVFENFAILPNIKNGFEKKSMLRTAETIHPVFLEIADVVVAEVPKLFVQKPFKLSQEFSDYPRKQLSKDWNARFSELTQSMSDEHLLTDETRDALILLCSTFPALDNKAVRGSIVEMIRKFYNNNTADIQIANIEDDFMEYSIPLKCLFSHFLYDIVKRSKEGVDWVENNLPLLHEAHGLLAGKLFEDIKKSHPIFPDQNYMLKVQDTLLIQDDVPVGLKELYYDVFKKDVKKDLILEGFEGYLPHEMTKTGATLAGEINTHLESVGNYNEVNTHPLKAIINKILTLITGKDAELWTKLFITISERKETIMMARISKKEVKDSMFSILDLEDEMKIRMLGDLAKDEDMIRIIELGKESFALEQSTKADFYFKHSIGTHIERLLFERIKNDMDKKGLEVKTQSKQDGQDIVVLKDGEPIYYIEVKSRWKSKSVISMSRNQMNRSVEHPEVYALCCIDMIDYYPEEGNRNYPEDITLILDRIRSVTDIGEQIAPLIDNAIVFEKDADAVKLTGEYRATVPQKIVGKGLKFDPFIDFLFNKLVELLEIEK